MDSPSWLVIGGVIALLGIGCIFVPVIVEPTPAFEQYQLSVQATSSVPSDATVIAYTNLSQKAQSAFDEARTGGSVTLTRAQHKSAIKAFSTHKYVTYRDQPYRVRMYHHDSADSSNQALRLIGGVLTALGGALVIFGGFVVWKHKLRVLTPRNSLLLPVGAGTAFYFSPASITGGSLSLPPPSLSLSLIGLPAIALMIPGTLYARGLTLEAIGVCLGGLILLAIGLLWTGTPLVGVTTILLFVVIIGGTLGAIPFALGARLTEGGDLPIHAF